MSERRTALLRAIAMVGAGVVFAILVIGAASRIAHGKLGDFTHFYAAAEAARFGGDIHESGEGGYIYPPLLAFLFQPLTFLGLNTGAMVWLGMNAAILAFATWAASKQAAERFGLAAGRKMTALIASAAILLMIDKTRATLNQEQTDSLVLLGFVLGLAGLRRYPALSGIAIGFGANIKYLSVVAIPYLIIRRRWEAAAWAIGSTAAWALLPAVSLGWTGNLRALERSCAGLLAAVGLSAEAGAANIHADDWHLSLSITSAVSRFLGPGGSSVAKAGVVAMAAGAVLAAAWWIYAVRKRPMLAPESAGPSDLASSRVTALEWCGLIVASLAFGPQTTGRHLVLLLGVLPFAVAILLTPGTTWRKGALVAGVVLLELGLNLPPGGRAFEGAVDGWRAVGGASWCMLAMYLSMLWAGLPQGGQPGVNPATVRGIEPFDPEGAGTER